MSAPERRFVSRGGEKLNAALTTFAVEVAGRRALDAGAATGGFTDALLRAGAASVVAVDVAYGQFDWGLRNDQRVQLLERTNVRSLDAAAIGEPVSVIVADLSFIDLRKVRAAFDAVATPDADAILLVKPQFELPRERIPRGGVVREPSDWLAAMTLVVDGYAPEWGLRDATPSPIVGPKGNREFLLWLTRGHPAVERDVLARAVAEAP